MAFSVAPLLKRQSPSHAYGHGWIVGDEGKRWHPAHSQIELLAGLSGKRKKSWLTKLKVSLCK
ncbi:phage filamentation protein Fil family protein [Type-D symbiont of Plautia stali]|uniref:phage filamentation protein Fil family protein n=1 Tax=Type-D symbiont of Plautia stali TaxID=1560356 RepID=UPI00092F5E52|nr:phage filamentation protein Fil family protein [Type-D symbiont of Plautia stali]